MLMQPSASNALENQPAFRAASRQAWDISAHGLRPREAGFAVSGQGFTGTVAKADNTDHGEVAVPMQADTIAIVHTHPNSVQDKPSLNDIAQAKRNKVMVYVISRTGLWEVETDGTVVHVYFNEEWMR